MPPSLQPATAPKADFTYVGREGITTVNAGNPIVKITTPKDMYRRLVWWGIGLAAVGSGFTFAGNIIFYAGGRIITKIPHIVGNAAPPPRLEAWLGEGHPVAPLNYTGGPSFTQLSTGSQSLKAEAVPMVLACDTIALDGSITVSAGTVQAFLACMSENPI